VTAIGALSWVAGTVMLPGTVATVGVLDASVTICVGRLHGVEGDSQGAGAPLKQLTA
jgi:hypothetical protein